MNDISETIQEVILQHIDSVSELEALLLRENRQKSWSVDAVAARLHVTGATASDVLEKLGLRGFLSTECELYRYQPKSAELNDLVALLAETYRRRLIAVTPT